MATIGTAGRVVREGEPTEKRDSTWVLTMRRGELWLVPRSELELEEEPTDLILVDTISRPA